MNQFPYLYPHSLSEAERLNEEELWQDNRDAEVSHTQLTEMFRHSDPAALMDEAEQAQLAELDDTVTVCLQPVRHFRMCRRSVFFAYAREYVW